MILIADSGATKTEWGCVSRDGSTRIGFFSQGYNPNYITGSQIVADIRANLPAELDPYMVDEIYFYGFINSCFKLNIRFIFFRKVTIFKYTI